MLAIPFGIVGAIIGHVILGFDLSMVSALVFVALSDVVVNYSLVLVTTTNDYQDEGKSSYDALAQAGARRFRPVLLTSLTTFLASLQ